MRTYLFGLVAIGLVGSILTRTPTSAPRKSEVAPNASADPTPDSVEVSNGSLSADTVVLERSADGHFYADVDVNTAKLHMLVDTGASEVALSRDDARAASVATSIGMNNVIGEGAGGSVYGEQVTIERISLGGKSAENMPAFVLSDGTRSLLGQSFLAKYASVEIHGDRMILR